MIFFLFTLYNVPVILAGTRNLLESRERGKKKPSETAESKDVEKADDGLPFVSILVPAKNEEKVIGRLLDALLGLDYPAGKREIIVVNDASVDGTREICLEYASAHPEVMVVDRSVSSTKAAALNFGLKSAVRRGNCYF